MGGTSKLNGVLVVDKPAGPTSHDVVSRVRKALREKKVGHTGTLDPAATGVLPLVLGNATKVARYLTGSDKRYHATIRLGTETSTLDGEGEITRESEVEVDEARVREVLGGFVGEISQIPPMYSAKKIEGKRLYELARKGLEVEREPKRVTVRSLELISCELPDVFIDVTCSAGTYVRVLAADIGNALGCGGYLHALRRVAAGPFSIESAVPLEQVEDEPESVVATIVSMEEALREIPRIDLPPSIAKMIASGHQLTVADLRTLDTPPFGEGQPITLGIDGGGLVAIATSVIASDDLMRSRRDQRALKTERVFVRSP